AAATSAGLSTSPDAGSWSEPRSTGWRAILAILNETPPGLSYGREAFCLLRSPASLLPAANTQRGQDRPRRLGVRPGEGVTERGILRGEELAEVDDVLSEQVLVLPRQAHVVQAGIVRADHDVHPGPLAPLEHHAKVVQVGERAGLEIS